MKLKVNIGCGSSPTEGWINFDNTPAIKLAHSPFKFWILKLFGLLNPSQLENVEWNKENKILFADATNRIPLSDSSAECIYSSHMFEHLCRDGAKLFLKDALRVLDNGGVLRVSVPDLQHFINNYIAKKDANEFMSKMHVSAPPLNSLRQKLLLFFVGYRHHQWMYDGVSLSKLMLESGFKDVIVQNAGETCIKNFIGLNLFEREEESVYVEAIK
jgi:predicted SAM-dependent methyltransferase